MNTRLRLLLAALFTLVLLALLTSLRPDALSRFGAVQFSSTPHEEESLPTESPQKPPPPSCIPENKPLEPKKISPWDSSLFLKGAPTALGLDNLLEDRFYVTASTVEGFTNQFISYMNLIYLGILSDRIPILPPFVPSHHTPQGTLALPFSEVFNISSFREAIHYPILEWREVKDINPNSIHTPPPSRREKIGCWSASKPSSPYPALGLEAFNNARLDAAFSRVPASGRINETNPEDYFVVLNQIVPFIYPRHPHPHNEVVMTTTSDGQSLSPNHHLACFDLLYYASTTRQMFEWDQEWSPLWMQVGKHARFTDALEGIVRQYLAEVLAADINHLPPYVAVHVRRGDFRNICDLRPNCLIPIPKFEDKVEEIKKAAEEKFGYPVEKVLLFSDETDDEFWSQIDALGWSRFDHVALETVEKYGLWYTTLIDVVAQSMAHGFVGTGASTFSLLALRRVMHWQDGPATLVWE